MICSRAVVSAVALSPFWDTLAVTAMCERRRLVLWAVVRSTPFPSGVDSPSHSTSLPCSSDWPPSSTRFLLLLVLPTLSLRLRMPPVARTQYDSVNPVAR